MMAFSAPSAFAAGGGAGLLASPSGSRLTANRSPAAVKVLEFCASKPEVNKRSFVFTFPHQHRRTDGGQKKKKLNLDQTKNKKFI